MADIKSKYPATSSVALALTLAGLAADSNLLAGRASTAVDNTSNLDLDHLLSGIITTGTSPTSGGYIEIWAWVSYKTAAGAPTYPDGITGNDAAKTMTSANAKQAALRLVAAITVDSVTGRNYTFAPVSIASLFGAMPKFWGLFITHSTGTALGNADLQYERIQAQTV